MQNLYFALLHSLGLSHKKLREISLHQAQDFFENVDIQKLLSIGYNIESAQKIVDKKVDLDVEHVERTLQLLQVDIIHISDTSFPELLRNIPDAPTILYVRGKIDPLRPLLSVVGSRKYSQYAQSCLQKILPDLVRAGFGIVSGGAYGIDSIAHETALQYSGYTAVVFGSGIDVAYPVSNTRLFEQVVATGGVCISHFPLGTAAEPFNFPIRNSLVAGISKGTLIAEAGEDSGTLITARLAVEYNRDVFIIPADITREGARGSNALIRDGLGKLILGSEDILAEYQMSNVDTLTEKKFDDKNHEKVYKILLDGPKSVDDIVDISQLEMSTIINILMLLEIEGHIFSSQGIYHV